MALRKPPPRRNEEGGAGSWLRPLDLPVLQRLRVAAGQQPPLQQNIYPSGTVPWTSLPPAPAPRGKARQSRALRGKAWLRMAKHGRAWQSVALHGRAWQSMAERGKAWQSVAPHGKAWQSMAEHGKARQSAAKPGSAQPSLAPLRTAATCGSVPSGDSPGTATSRPCVPAEGTVGPSWGNGVRGPSTPCPGWPSAVGAHAGIGASPSPSRCGTRVVMATGSRAPSRCHSCSSRPRRRCARGWPGPLPSPRCGSGSTRSPPGSARAAHASTHAACARGWHPQLCAGGYHTGPGTVLGRGHGARDPPHATWVQACVPHTAPLLTG